jgi:RimJ/RimL family protein N-acetyltransferase
MKEPSVAPPPFVLRRLGPADASAYRALRLGGLRDAPQAFAASFEEERQRPLAWFADRLQTSVVFGGFAREALVGVAGLRASTTAKLAHIGHLWGVYVAPPARGKGLAAALCRRILEEAPSGVEQVHLAVASSNRAALRLYASLGFKEYGLERRALKVGGEYYDEVLMALSPRR